MANNKKEIFDDIKKDNFSLNLLYNKAQNQNSLFAITLDGYFLHVSTPKSIIQIERFLNVNRKYLNEKIIFYDLETTGRPAYWDQIIQIAAICTDENLNVLDEMNLIGQLNSFSVPDPEALLVNKIPIDSIYKSNFSNYSLISEISHKFSEWSLYFIGYNSIKFDEEVIRNAFFKNLFDPYLTVKNDNTRIDLLEITRIANFFTIKLKVY